MSDVSQLFSGRLSPLEFIAKEWAAAARLVEALPAEVRPLGEALLGDAEAAVTAAEAWTGTAVSAFLSANAGGLQTEILNLLSGLGAGAAPVSAAAQDVLAAALKLLLALVANTVVSFQQANTPAGPAAGGASS
jgi:hypothetical protein